MSPAPGTWGTTRSPKPESREEERKDKEKERWRGEVGMSVQKRSNEQGKVGMPEGKQGAG